MMPTRPAVLSAELHAAIIRWKSQDPDPRTRDQLDRLTETAETGDEASALELTEAFAGPLTFGTAGLRGKIGPGPGRMNRVVVAQAAAGLAGYLVDQGEHGSKVVIGYDARHYSDVFAHDTAEILAGAGFSPQLLPQSLPTPVLAFAIRQLGCSAGVMVTASHNPRQDNGYKVYLGDGVQIVPPADAGVAAKITEVAAGSVMDLSRSDAITVVGPELLEAYLDRAVATVADATLDSRVELVYTPLHGVGGKVVPELLERAGFGRPLVATTQAEPDPDFPTAAFPNPEEQGALEPAYAFADEHKIVLVIANDPDADRCAVAVKRVDAAPGEPARRTTARASAGWQRLTGDQLGALLGDDALRRGVSGTYAASIVSSSLLSTMAAAHRQPFAATLTGFKWIARVPGLVYGYEEALGYCCDPAAVTDKDGMTALLRVVAIITALSADGRTLDDRLDEIDRTYGLHATNQFAVRVSNLSVISDAMARLRSQPPAALAGEPVRVVDLADGTDGLPPTDGVLLTGNSVRVVARPSGTEPKLKCYLEVRLSPPDSQDLTTARARAADTLVRLQAEMATALGV